ncbi:serine/threonine-protein kinase [Actinoplanes sp. NPDC049548]|uniref:serine/threonine-protein kinase n=1 Tax=Actinoplanes sp. NPDC049548 TaxID=3155152 RepID=UPI00343F2DEE
MTDDWPAAGDLLASRYRLVTLLESGGMADIWRAADELLDRPVALKLPTGRTATSAEALHLAWREARMAARPAHPGIAVVHDYNGAVRPDGSVAPFVVMELLTGETLAARVERAPLAWPDAARIGRDVADALAAAHASGVVHRDIKPGNVMLTPAGVKILDFGISALTGEPDDDESGITFGTPAYVAPERLDGKPAEPATDVYGLGVLLFEMVTGDPPYPVDTWEELATARAHGPTPLRPGLPAPFRVLVTDCLLDEPGRRPSAEEVSDRLAATTDEPAPPRHSGRWRVAVSAGIAAVLATAAGTVVLIGPSVRDAPPVLAPPPATVTATPSVAPSPPRPTSARPARARIGFDDAVQRVRAAVDDGRTAGQIRPDVATDLNNLLDTLDSPRAADVGTRLDDLRRKVRARTDEGSLAEDRAAVLQSRLDDLGRAAGI